MTLMPKALQAAWDKYLERSGRLAQIVKDVETLTVELAKKGASNPRTEAQILIGEKYNLGQRQIQRICSNERREQQELYREWEAQGAKMRRTILELTEQTCRWPVGDPDSAEFFFCGGNTIAGMPYCAYHSRVALGQLLDLTYDRDGKMVSLRYKRAAHDKK
jgi:hypothetical protein